MSISRLGRELCLVVDDEKFFKEDIQKMTDEQLHMLCGFLETERELEFVKDNTENEKVHVYIHNLLMKL